jgi:hypothetical protein
MTVTAPPIPRYTRPPRRYLRPIEPLIFPAFDPEAGAEPLRHLAIRTALWQAIRADFPGPLACGCGQDVLWDEHDPSARCVPDVFVCLGKEPPRDATWNTWEHGTPELVIEVIDPWDARDRNWEEKLAQYRALGTRELVRFDADDGRRPIRIWDRIDRDLVERDAADPRISRCDTLDAFFCVRGDAKYGPWLYLAHDRDGREPYPTEAYARQRESEARERAERAP